MDESCRCDCGYRCGGPGRCELGVFKCLQMTDGNHFVRDCDHKWDGPWVDLADGGSISCANCGVLACSHDMMVGP